MTSEDRASGGRMTGPVAVATITRVGRYTWRVVAYRGHTRGSLRADTLTGRGAQRLARRYCRRLDREAQWRADEQRITAMRQGPPVGNQPEAT